MLEDRSASEAEHCWSLMKLNDCVHSYCVKFSKHTSRSFSVQHQIQHGRVKAGFLSVLQYPGSEVCEQNYVRVRVRVRVTHPLGSNG